MATKKPKPATKYTWVIDRNNDVLCYPGDGGQTVIKLWEVGQLTSLHDSELAAATREINAILSKIEKNNKDPERTLSFIEFQNRHLLVWARYGAVGPNDDKATVMKRLSLKAK